MVGQVAGRVNNQPCHLRSDRDELPSLYARLLRKYSYDPDELVLELANRRIGESAKSLIMLGPRSHHHARSFSLQLKCLERVFEAGFLSPSLPLLISAPCPPLISELRFGKMVAHVVHPAYMNAT